MQDQFLQYIILGLLLIGLVMLANKLKLPYPIVLVLGGLAISFSQMFSHVTIDPELIFFIFLPPLLYEAAWQISWREFWKYRRVIISFAFPIVIITSCVVAFASNAFIPGFTLALGFLLGGIVSPPDAISATTIMRQLKAPKILQTVAEGESLLNDASALIVFRFALAAIVTGQFRFTEAAGNFFLVVVAGTAIGICVGFIFYAIHRWLPTTPSIEIVLTFITPYCMYYAAEHFHFSGILAVVSGGLFLTYRSQEIFTYETRLHVAGLWETLIFLLNGLVFILIGLQLPEIVNGLGDYSVYEAVIYAIIISLLTIVIRIIWVFPNAYIPRLLFKSIREKETKPTWQGVFLVAWAGMRGVVSLAAALAIPLTLNNGPFPFRNLILFITFVVILFTLVIQGLTLKPLLRKLDIKMDDEEEDKRKALTLRVRLAESVLSYIDANYIDETQKNETYKRVRDRYERMIEITRKKLDSDNLDDDPDSFLPQYRQMLLELVHIRRRELMYFRYKNEYPEELIREREWELDLEEARLRN